MTAWKFISRVLLFSTILSGCCSTKSSDVNVCALWSENGKVSSELKDLIYVGVSPAGGTSAGRFSKVKVNRWEDCVSQCCQFERCNVAYWISSVCVHIECVSDELCAPMESRDNERNDENIYLKVRSVQSTAAAIDYDDPGRDECNATQACPVNERCEQVTVSAEIKRNVCLCDRKNDFRRINGVCRQYLPRGKPCAVYDKDYDLTDGADDDDQDRNGKRGRCGKNEDCLPPNDRAKHGYCQCRLGFQRDSDSGKCVVDEQVETSTVPISPPRTTSISSSFDLDVEAGVDQTITWPISQVDLYGRALYKSNKSEVDVAALNNRNLSLSWSLKSSNNGAKIDLTNPGDSTSHIVVKQLREGVYEFELHLNGQQGLTLASDIVKVAVVSTTTTPSPLNVQITSPVNVRLPQQIVKLEARVEPANRHVTYQWTHGNDGPTTPIIEDMDKPILTISNLRPGTYSFRLHVVDIFGNEQSKTVQIVATGEPIEAQVANRREVVFWPSTDVLLDGSSSIVEQQTAISWTLLSSDNKQRLSEVEISMPHSLKTRVSNLRIGQYKFQLTLATKDEEYVSKKDVLVIVYAQNGQPPKLAIRLETTNVNIISNLIVLNASNTTADYGIDRWLWKKGPSSPAMGNFINDSDQSPVAYVTNLIEGTYVFTLQVFDDRQQMSESNITVAVRGLANAQDLIEILFASKPYLRQQTLDNLLAQIRVFLLDISPSIDIVMVGMPKENMLLIKGIDSKTDAVVSPKLVANHLQSKIKSLRSASNVDIASIDTYLCLSNCSNHGKCDQKTKRCVCNRYYMENWFKSLVHREPNCDFITHYFVAAAVSGLLFTIIFCWLCLCCCRRWRRRRNLLERRRRIRYQLLHEDEDDEDQDHLSPQSSLQKGRGKSRPMKKTKTKTSNVIISESDGDASDEHGEQTLYDKPLLTGKGRALKVPVQDSNGSPMLRNNGQSPTTTDNSMA